MDQHAPQVRGQASRTRLLWHLPFLAFLAHLRDAQSTKTVFLYCLADGMQKLGAPSKDRAECGYDQTVTSHLAWPAGVARNGLEGRLIQFRVGAHRVETVVAIEEAPEA